MMIKVKYYETDAYTTIEGLMSNIDNTYRTITVVKTKISFDDILDISGDGITELE